MSPEIALSLCRFLLYATAIFLWGSSAYLAALVPAGLSAAIARKLRILNLMARVLLVAAIFVTPLALTATIGDGWSDLRMGLIISVVVDTAGGHAWMIQLSTTLALCASSAVLTRHDRAAHALCAFVLLASMTFTGHAAMNDGWLRILHRLNDALHLLSGGAWLGSLVPVFLMFSALDNGEWRAEARLALMRFSTAGHIAVALVLLTGVANTLLIVGGMPTDWTLAYQRLLCLKILVVAGMVTIAVINRYVLVPRLSAAGSLSALKRSTGMAIALGLSSLALVAWFGMLQPT
ncbi:copper homeostasis membrane protein CopD [Rhizobium sp. S152]|uniref:copper homeostasis membrane protein CopD n=1 Tax=Rhizobium sp. S152 TaxID=3055038 RepID=UPI0025A9597B|nr:copper homeostasis membrane protein CopD [Rhizobium sp. S152]MDM9624612.1 copper homeostasis membrane protein CopD [Rhizobium sp. S152]